MYLPIRLFLGLLPKAAILNTFTWEEIPLNSVGFTLQFTYNCTACALYQPLQDRLYSFAASSVNHRIGRQAVLIQEEMSQRQCDSICLMLQIQQLCIFVFVMQKNLTHNNVVVQIGCDRLFRRVIYILSLICHHWLILGFSTLCIFKLVQCALNQYCRIGKGGKNLGNLPSSQSAFPFFRKIQKC